MKPPLEASLPGKTLFGKNDAKVIHDRMEGLNAYLSVLLSKDECIEHPALTAFLAKVPLAAETAHPNPNPNPNSNPHSPLIPPSPLPRISLWSTTRR